MQLRASALPPNLTRNLEAKIAGQRYEIQTPQRDLQTTRDSLNSWDEVNLTSIQGVFVDERVATSTSSVSRITEPAISHLPQAVQYGVTPSCSYRGSAQCQKQHQHCLQVRVRHHRASRKLQWQYTILLFRRFFFTNRKYRSYSDST